MKNLEANVLGQQDGYVLVITYLGIIIINSTLFFFFCSSQSKSQDRAVAVWWWWTMGLTGGNKSSYSYWCMRSLEMEQRRPKVLLDKMLNYPFLDIFESVYCISEMGVYTEILISDRYVILELLSLILVMFLRDYLSYISAKKKKQAQKSSSFPTSPSSTNCSSQMSHPGGLG